MSRKATQTSIDVTVFEQLVENKLRLMNCINSATRIPGLYVIIYHPFCTCVLQYTCICGSGVIKNFNRVTQWWLGGQNVGLATLASRVRVPVMTLLGYF